MKKIILGVLLCATIVPALNLNALENKYTDEQLIQGGGLDDCSNILFLFIIK